MAQGNVGDCWLMASLAEVANRDPQDIKGMFTYDGKTLDGGSTVGLYTVRLYDTSGSAIYVSVDTLLPSAGGLSAHVQNGLGTKALWVALAEKAYAEANGFGYVSTNHEDQDAYTTPELGDASWTLHAITGKAASDNRIAATSLAADWNVNDLIVLCTDTPASSYIVGNHCYAIVGYNASSSEPSELYNPWGTGSLGWAPGDSGKIYGRFWIDATLISPNFTHRSPGAGAVDDADDVGKFDAIIDLAARAAAPDPFRLFRSAWQKPASGRLTAGTSPALAPGLVGDIG